MNAEAMSNNSSKSKSSPMRHALRYIGAFSAATGLLVNTITITVSSNSFEMDGPTVLAGWAYVPMSLLPNCRS